MKKLKSKRLRIIKNYVSTLILVIVGTVLFTRCNDSEQIDCKSCQASPDARVQLQLFNEQINVNVYSFNRNDQLYQFGTTKNHLTNSLRTKLIKVLKLNNSLSYDIVDVVGIVPFISENLENLGGLESSQIFGATIYYMKQGNIYLDGYKVKNNQLTKINSEPIVVYGISAQDIHVLSLVASDSSYDVIGSLAFVKYSGLPKVNLLGNKITKNLLNEGNKYKAPIRGLNGGGSTCNEMSPCGSERGATCIASENEGGESWTCWISYWDEEEGICPRDEVQAVANLNSITGPLGLDIFLHDFKDNFLAGSDKGEVYRRLYYVLGRELAKQTYSATFVVESYYIAESLLWPKLDELMNSTNVNSILLTQTEADSIINYLNQVSGLSSDPMFESIIFTVQLDINNYVGKTIQSVRNDF
ncbi:MAG: hypothetical protein COA58_03970 [Bacteroidetes bacterium]|nr:MAG: hypothetical protein COA58_03970 [Bacteroidota bacterium]